MVKFFRRIRFKLMETGKTGTYLKYAIGEIILVVIGILIALQINNWNENRKRNEQRKELVSNLIIDFRSTNENIDLALTKLEDELNGMNSFYGLINNEEQIISIDSLKVLTEVFFVGDFFKPNITSYNEAVSNGELKLVKSRILIKHIDTFFEASDNFGFLYNRFGEAYFNGPIWELRKSLGSSQSILTGRSSFTAMPYKKLSYEEFVKTMNAPLTTATFESVYIIKLNLFRQLNIMKTSCDSIISTLNNLD